ncbi:uncharacterized protein RCO7_15193 [Rhynchosporium graminicola]|uniref:Uncharacterized protein n=1 Tax=Rhynchosporium graminicola TaxID=2792576 RepID=A0A1E1LQE0_9HELO|nr:uncharacterized protein RCO7_15193 [Rhynchosporium commune]
MTLFSACSSFDHHCDRGNFEYREDREEKFSSGLFSLRRIILRKMTQCE